MKAKDLKPGMRYRYDNIIVEVTAIQKITDKAITYTTKRISPDYYDGNFFNRKSLNTEVTIINQ
jgi:hypothetical protein